ncbi:MAG: VOC family protein [Myxococcota bacterium]
MSSRIGLTLGGLLMGACGGAAPPPEVAEALACAQRWQTAEDPPPDDGSGVRFFCTTPIFRVSDIRASLRQYREDFGFTVAWTWGDPVGFAAVRRGHSELFFCDDCQGNFGTWVTMFVDDVDQLHAEYQERGARVVQPPTDHTWGLREMRVQDRDGHVLRLGQGIDLD